MTTIPQWVADEAADSFVQRARAERRHVQINRTGEWKIETIDYSRINPDATLGQCVVVSAMVIPVVVAMAPPDEDLDVFRMVDWPTVPGVLLAAEHGALELEYDNVKLDELYRSYLAKQR